MVSGASRPKFPAPPHTLTALFWIPAQASLFSLLLFCSLTKYVILTKRFTLCVLWTNSMSITWAFVRNADLMPFYTQTS